MHLVRCLDAAHARAFGGMAGLEVVDIGVFEGLGQPATSSAITERTWVSVSAPNTSGTTITPSRWSLYILLGIIRPSLLLLPPTS